MSKALKGRQTFPGSFFRTFSALSFINQDPRACALGYKYFVTSWLFILYLLPLFFRISALPHFF
jgi:hypothetical protein